MELSLKRLNLDLREVENVGDQRKAQQNHQVNPDRKHANPREELFMFLLRDDPEEMGQVALQVLYQVL